jgi:ubiquinone/menaquinone biosynthesis C-methylase UbiE
MEDLLTQLKAVAEPTRLRIVAICAPGELTVSELTQILGQSQPRVSRHLKLLCDAGLLTRYPEGAWVFYRLNDGGSSPAGALCRAILNLVPLDDPQFRRDRQRLAEVREARKAVAEAYFSSNAGQWDSIRSLHVDDAEVEDKLTALVPIGPADSILDIGTGTGRILELFGRNTARGVGVDFSREMLSLARTRLTDANLANCQVRQGDMYQLPVDDAEFDIATLHLVLHFADDPAAVISEAVRALAPSGRLVVVDYAPHKVEELRDTRAHRRLGFGDAEIEDLFSGAGLRMAGVHTLPGDPLTVNIWVGEKLPSGDAVGSAIQTPTFERVSP